MKKLFLYVLATALSIMSCSSARSTDANLKDSVNAYSEISKKLDSIEQRTKKIAEMQNTIEQLKDSLINEVDKYICSVAPRSKMTADNIVNQSDMPKQNAEQFVFEQPDLFSSPIVNATNVQPVTSVEAARPQTVVKEKPVIKEVVKYIDKKPRKVVEVRIFYDDGTYETFS